MTARELSRRRGHMVFAQSGEELSRAKRNQRRLLRTNVTTPITAETMAPKATSTPMMMNQWGMTDPYQVPPDWAAGSIALSWSQAVEVG